jgi:50S ribosomal protein L16 3-hydroxylase
LILKSDGFTGTVATDWFQNADLSYHQFEQTYWRRQPWAAQGLFENLLESISEQLNKKKLLELSADEMIDTRIISRQPAMSKDDHPYDYELALGPFEQASLVTGEMLMLQGLEQHLPVIAELLTNHFGFLPRWRIDDVMASYGNTGASCGPHFDHYDVFLLQVRGEKQWLLADGPFSDADLLPDVDIRLLEHFPFSQTLTQSAGDLLYIPPGVGHYGIASDDSLTLSIGLRNPTLVEMISSLADQITDSITTTETLDDQLGAADMGLQAMDIEQLSSRLIPVLSQPEAISRWFGCYMTEPPRPELIEPEDEINLDWDNLDAQTQQGYLVCHLATRLCHQARASDTLLFVNGEALEAPADVNNWFAPLARLRTIPLTLIPADPVQQALVTYLLDTGAVTLEGIDSPSAQF